MAAQTPSRKQWSLSRGPKGNVQSLVWAECGCPQQQVNLAKQLLEDNGEECVDKEEKARLGVYWLTKASEKGDEEATQMLQDCIEHGIGITEHNLSDVKICLEMSRGEKLSREAAKEVFLSLSQGENFVTTYQLHKEISKCCEENANIEGGILQNWNLLEEGSGEKLSEEMLVSAASHHSRGELPLVLKGLVLRNSMLSALVDNVCEISAVSQFYYIVLTLFILLGFDIFIGAIPMFLYYGSLLAMIISTCQVIVKKWEFAHFQRWSNLLVAYGCHEEISVEGQWSHCLKNSRPCFVFLVSLLINLLLAPYVSDPPLSEITIFSTFISLFCLYNFARYKKKIDVLSIVTFVIHLLARYPYDRDTLVSQYWRNLDVHIPAFSSYVLGSSIEFCLNFQVLFYLMLPGLFIGMAARDRWLGVFKTLLPHLVCLSWWQMAVIASKGSTYFGLNRAFLGLVCILIFVPIMSFMMLLIPLATITKFFITQTISTEIAIGGILLSTALYLGTKWKRGRKLFYNLMVLLSLVSLFFIVSYETDSVPHKKLEWNEYENICSGNDIKSTESCLSLSGISVTWVGNVLASRIASVHNPISPLVHRLPEALQETLKCIVGERFPSCEEGSDNDVFPCSLKCHISNWNRYEYEFEIELSSKSWVRETKYTALLIGGGDFQNYSLSLKVGDSIWFRGYLMNNIHNHQHPYIRLQALGLMESSSDNTDGDVQTNAITVIFKPFINFFFYPFMVLR